MRRKYDRQGMLALDPKALFALFSEAEQENMLQGSVAVVPIVGPLDHHAGWWCDSYDAIRERVKAACESSARTVVLKIDSPGGDVSGCFETARELRRMCEAAGKPLVAYVDGQACSGGYALACAASEIVVPHTGIVGSVGVINTRVDVSEYDAREGFRFAVTASGKRKADGHPHKALSEGESAATQTIVDSLAEVFFDLVAELRGIPQAQLAGLEAGVFHGEGALRVGLADRVMSFDELLAAIESGDFNTEKVMKISMEDARKALEEAAQSDDEQEAKRAKRALAAMDEEESGAEDEEEKTDAMDEDEESEAEGDDKEPEAEGDDDEPKSKKASRSLELKAVAQVDKLAKDVASLKRANAARDRKEVKEFLAGCKWLSKETRELLEDQPLAKAKQIAASMKPKLPAAAAAASVMGTRGETQTNSPAGRSDPGFQAAMDLRMGLVELEKATVQDGSVVSFGVTKPKGQ